jgi:hypothetical protein
LLFIRGSSPRSIVTVISVGNEYSEALADIANAGRANIVIPNINLFFIILLD